jgi:hypothetical protein
VGHARLAATIGIDPDRVGVELVSTSDEDAGSPAMIIRSRLPRSFTGHA